MKNICKKFEKSILFALKWIMYALAFATFFLLFSLDNREIIDLSRTAAVTLSTYVIILVLLSGTYGSYEIGSRKEKDILFSLTIASLLTDLITYSVLLQTRPTVCSAVLLTQLSAVTVRSTSLTNGRSLIL